MKRKNMVTEKDNDSLVSSNEETGSITVDSFETDSTVSDMNIVSDMTISGVSPLTSLVQEGDVIELTTDISYRGKIYYASTRGVVKALYPVGSYNHNVYAKPLGIKDTAIYFTVEGDPDLTSGAVISSSFSNYKLV